MAETYKNILATLPNTMTTVYTCPAGKSAIVLGLQTANIHASSYVSVSVQLVDASAGGAVKHLAKSTPVPLGSAIDPCVGKVFLEPGDAIQMMASSPDGLDVVGAVLEIS